MSRNIRISASIRAVLPERLYDAAGWTLPLQMGVKVTTASKPLTAEMRAKMKLLGPEPDPRAKPSPYNTEGGSDAAAFDSVPGIGFNSNAAAAAIVPPPGKLSGSGSALAVDPAQNNAFRAINRAWKQGASVQFVAGTAGHGARYLIRALLRRRNLNSSAHLPSWPNAPTRPGQILRSRASA